MGLGAPEGALITFGGNGRACGSQTCIAMFPSVPRSSQAAIAAFCGLGKFCGDGSSVAASPWAEQLVPLWSKEACYGIGIEHFSLVAEIPVSPGQDLCPMASWEI